MALSKSQVKNLQRDLNHFSRDRSLDLAPLIVDGELGKHTRDRVRYVHFLLGYNRKRVSSKVDYDFRFQLNHPRKARKPGHRVRVRRGLRRRIRRRREVARNHVKAVRASGVTYYDGRPVAKWLVPYLEWARKNGWQGRLVSGWRDPAYSERLCYGMCGRPQCPGRCAGRASGHSQSTYPGGCMDVSDYVRFGQLMAKCPLQPHLRNVLPYDRVHYSVTGR